jgi:drug/metabolite transporter (DMT)-like permease
VLLAWIMLGEIMGAAELVGGAAVLTGVALTTRSPGAAGRHRSRSATRR